MQLITAIMQPFILDRLTRALRKHAIPGYTITHVQGSAGTLDNSPEYLQTNIKIEIIVNDSDADKVVELITTAIGTREGAEGVVYSVPVSHFANIKTGLRGPEALTVGPQE